MLKFKFYFTYQVSESVFSTNLKMTIVLIRCEIKWLETEIGFTVGSVIHSYFQISFQKSTGIFKY